MGLAWFSVNRALLPSGMFVCKNSSGARTQPPWRLCKWFGALLSPFVCLTQAWTHLAQVVAAARLLAQRQLPASPVRSSSCLPLHRAPNRPLLRSRRHRSTRLGSSLHAAAPVWLWEGCFCLLCLSFP